MQKWGHYMISLAIQKRQLTNYSLSSLSTWIHRSGILLPVSYASLEYVQKTSYFFSCVNQSCLFEFWVNILTPSVLHLLRARGNWKNMREYLHTMDRLIPPPLSSILSAYRNPFCHPHEIIHHIVIWRQTNNWF